MDNDTDNFDDFDFVDEDGEPDDSMEHVDDEPDDCAVDVLDDEEELQDPVPLMNTRVLKGRLNGQDMTAKVKTILDCMNSQGVNLPLFLDALSWGDPRCHSDPKVQYARTSLMVSDELPGILERWHCPPRGSVKKEGETTNRSTQAIARIRCEMYQPMHCEGAQTFICDVPFST